MCASFDFSVAYQYALTFPAQFIATGRATSGQALVGASCRASSRVHTFSLVRDASCHVTNTSTTLITATSPGPLAIVDFDHDTFTDVVVGTNDDSLSFAYGTSGGGFAAPVVLMTMLGELSAIATPDFEGDSLRDVVLWEAGARIRSFRQSPARSVAILSTIGTLGSGLAYRDGTVAELDSDGGLDLALVFTSVSQARVGALLGDGSGGFALPSALPFGTQPSRVTAGQLGGEADTIVSVGGQTVVMGGFLGGGFMANSRALSGTELTDVVLADLDGIDPLEIVIADSANQVLHIEHGNPGSGELMDVGTIPVPLSPLALAVIDIDADGQDELVVMTATQVLIMTQVCP